MVNSGGQELMGGPVIGSRLPTFILEYFLLVLGKVCTYNHHFSLWLPDNKKLSVKLYIHISPTPTMNDSRVYLYKTNPNDFF